MRRIYQLEDNPKGSIFEVNIFNYSSPWEERLATLRSARPGNVGDGRDSPKLDGIGLGSDTIECGSHGPDPCRDWVYWAHVGNQLLNAHIWLNDDQPAMSADAFRAVLRHVFVADRGKLAEAS